VEEGVCETDKTWKSAVAGDFVKFVTKSPPLLALPLRLYRQTLRGTRWGGLKG
jgi:hypothetical protein